MTRSAGHRLSRQNLTRSAATSCMLLAMVWMAHETHRLSAESSQLLNDRTPDCKKQFANALRANNMAPDQLKLLRVRAIKPLPDGRLECTTDVDGRGNSGLPWDKKQHFRYPMPGAH